MKPKSKWCRSMTLFGLCCLGAATPAPVTPPSDIEGHRGPIELQTRTPETDPRRDATVQAIERVMPSVVNIATKNVVRVRDPLEDAFRRFWDPYYQRQISDELYSLGSGVLIEESGYLLTNDHVVQRAERIEVRFGSGTNVYVATVVARDPTNDLAMLRLNARPGEKFQAIRFAHEDDLLLGETVIALGNPFGLGGSVSRGILSSKDRVAAKEGEPLDIRNWLQTDAAINPGNSGGPLINLRGELIGINVGVLSQAQGIGFAIPIKRVLESLQEIIPTEFVKSLWFGARVKMAGLPLTITAVQPGSPAGLAGLKSGDSILRVNGQTPKSSLEFSELLATNAASTVALTIQRGRAQMDVAVNLVPEKSVFNAAMVRERLGLSLERLTPQTAERLRLAFSDGYMITGVEEGSPAAKAGVQAGMLLSAIDGQTPTDVTAAAKQLFPKKKGDQVHLEIIALQRIGNFLQLRQVPLQLELR